MPAYPNLLAPYDFGFLTLRNRVVMGAMHTRIETLDRPLERLTAFYRERARGEAGLILTGGVAPNPEGRMEDGAPVLNDESELAYHRGIVSAVHAEGSAIALQILHAGRYAKLAECVAPSAIRAPINKFIPKALTREEIERTIADFVRTATLARQAGYDGVEIMGSEGYLINEFAALRTNKRTDDYGGSFEGRTRLALEIVAAIRKAAGPRFLIIYRISAIDLVDEGMTGEEVQSLARLVERAGANILNTGIGWHEAVVPTIAAIVPRAAWTFAVARVKAAVTIPVIASNRINTPEVAEQVLSSGSADFVSMARPLLADPHFARKVRQGKQNEINTCIACNQACLDRIFSEQTASCLVNPMAGREIEYESAAPAASPKRIAVVGAGPAGLACAINAARRGHRVTLLERAPNIGGQFKLARAIPGKQEFNETVRYFQSQLARLGVELQTGHAASEDELAARQFDSIVLATGVKPRRWSIPGADHPKVLYYDDVLAGDRSVGRTVAIVGAGGIGFDIASWLLRDETNPDAVDGFLKAWGVDTALTSPGGLTAEPTAPRNGRRIAIFQRRNERMGGTLGKTTGWVLKAQLRRGGVGQYAGVTYRKVDDAGLHYSIGGEDKIMACDNVIVCAGQEPDRDLLQRLQARGLSVHLVGGSESATELDAVRAIEDATRLAFNF